MWRIKCHVHSCSSVSYFVIGPDGVGRHLARASAGHQHGDDEQARLHFARLHEEAAEGVEQPLLDPVVRVNCAEHTSLCKVVSSLCVLQCFWFMLGQILFSGMCAPRLRPTLLTARRSRTVKMVASSSMKQEALLRQMKDLRVNFVYHVISRSQTCRNV